MRCFSSPRSPPIHYFTHVWINQLFSWLEFPHSDIHESMNICFSSWLFAAYHVFLRLLVPRHSPYALSSLTFLILKLYNFHYKATSFFLVYLFSSIYFSMCFLCNFKLHITLYCLLIIPNMVELRRVELLTSCLQGRRSSQLSYSPINIFIFFDKYQCTIKVHWKINNESL